MMRIFSRKEKQEITMKTSQQLHNTTTDHNHEAEHKKFAQYCVFQAGNEEYAIPIELVQEVVKFSRPAFIPQMPNHILGMSNVRGDVYGIMDLELFFRMSTSPAKHNYFLVLDHDQYKVAIGIENVPDSLIVDEDMLEELKSSTIITMVSQQYLKGVIKKDKRMIIALDVLGIISSKNFTRQV
ncbi:MAG: chemotaxis protein CheW [Bacteroidota bacterium]